MACHYHLPIWREANRLLVLLEDAMRRFPRYHKYTVGTGHTALLGRVPIQWRRQ